ncbi:UNVERIFIED_CONTAM: hypothetical protein Sradi_5477600 [Sesamum radiatum]|uniref:Uncharacterized protein n=1 Tax=Sesamum radiatum TaxID=300843 RepID=A0AAW2LA45_SESRA
MCFLVCDEEETEVGRQQAPGSCPYCGGKVHAVDVGTRWRFCFIPVCFRFKRKTDVHSYLCFDPSWPVEPLGWENSYSYQLGRTKATAAQV